MSLKQVAVGFETGRRLQGGWYHRAVVTDVPRHWFSMMHMLRLATGWL